MPTPEEYKKYIIENEEIGQNYKKKEIARAIEALKKSDSFILFHNGEGKGGAISALTPDKMPHMLFYIKKMVQEIQTEMEKKYGTD